MGKLGYAVYTPNSGRPECWLTMALDDDWTAAYRLVYVGKGPLIRRARIAELRIVPTRPDFDPRRNYAQWERRTGSVPPRFRFEVLRRGLTARHVADGLAALGRVDEPDTADETLAPLDAAPAQRTAGRPGYGRKFYAAFAVRYDDIENSERSTSDKSTRKVLAREYKKPLTTIGKWIRTARQQGFLTPVLRGQRGGRATDAARKLGARGTK